MSTPQQQEYQKRYRLAHPMKNREWYLANKDKMNEMVRKWASEHPEYFVEYYKQHREKMCLATKKYNTKNRITVLELKIAQCTDPKQVTKLTTKLEAAKARLAAVEERYNELRSQGADHV